METSTKASLWLAMVLAVVTTLGPTTQAQDLSNLNLQDIDFNDVFSLLPSKSFNANKDIDHVLELISRIVPNRVKVPDIGSKLNMHDCFLEGLSSSIVRAGDVAFNLTNQRVSFSFGLAVNDISIGCSWNKKVLTATFVGTANAAVNKVGVSASISINIQPGAHPILDEFRVLHLEEINTSFTGLGFLNILAKKLGNILIKSSRERIITELEGNVAEKLQNKLIRLKVPQF